jgi:hypothetical protein
MRAFDAVVVGAGPAGLSAAAELAMAGSCLAIEQGPPVRRRRRDAPVELLEGVGGAGLFSDGKHSFFPSATALWTLPDEGALGRAFERTAALLHGHGVDAGALPAGAPPAPLPGRWREKRYPSIYVPFAERLSCIEALWAAGGERWSDARVIDAGRAGGELALVVDRAGRREEVLAGRVVVATGRWSPRWIRPWMTALGASFVFRRVEIGVRLEADAAHPVFARLPGVDGKLCFVDPDAPLEIRTFCTCRDGEVVLGASGDLRAFSGRADGPRTGRSNLGLVVRTHDPALGAEIERHLQAARPERLPLQEWLEQGPARLAPHFGEAGAAALTRAFARLAGHCPELARAPATVYAPCVEGVGAYPADDGALQVAPGVWIAGDAGGRFRGIVASMISGRYVADRIIRATR